MKVTFLNLLKSALQKIIWFYQTAVSSVIGPRCRFYPTCSHYAIEALELHGPFKGTALAASRICRCHPFNDGGYDPVPSPNDKPISGKHNHGSINVKPQEPLQHQEFQS